MEINDAIELFIQFKLVEEGLNQNSTIPSYKEDLKALNAYNDNLKKKSKGGQKDESKKH